MTINPLCPLCKGKTTKKGKTPSGYQRWGCRDCLVSFSESPNEQPTKKEVPSCFHCGSSNTWSKGHDRRICLACGRTYKYKEAA